MLSTDSDKDNYDEGEEESQMNSVNSSGRLWHGIVSMD